MSETDVRDLIARGGMASSAALRAEIGPCSVVSRAAQVGARAATSGEGWRRDEEGTLWFRRRDAISGPEREFTPDALAAMVTDGRMLGPGEPPLTADELAEAYATAVAEVERTTSAPARVYPRQTLEQAIAPRFPLEFWIDRDDVLRCRPRMADPVRGTRGSPPPPPELTQRADRPPLIERWRRRNDPQGEAVTPAWLEAYAISAGLLAHGERPDWSAVVDELRQLVA